MLPVGRLISIALLLTLAACHGEQAPVKGQRIALDRVPSQGEEPLSSPDTKGASWAVSANGQAIDFRKPGATPLVSLACRVKAGQPQITIIRHAPARPGEKALFPVIGNRVISRFKVDAALADHEWRWQGTLPADDRMFDVFKGNGELAATLPGGGTVKIGGSGVPSQFVTWCRAGGKAPAVKPAHQQPSPASTPR